MPPRERPQPRSGPSCPAPDSRTESASCEVRLPLLQEGTQAFARVLRGAREEEGLALELDAGRERGLEGRVDGLLRQPHRDRPLRGDLTCRALRLAEPCLLGDHAGDEPVGERFARGDHPPGEDHVHRDRLADGAGQALRPAGAGKDAEVDLRLAEHRRLRSNDEVGEHGQLTPAAEAVAGDGCNDRRPHLADCVPALEALVLVQRHRCCGRELADVCAGCEGALSAAEDDDADLRILVELRERGDDRVHQLARERVELLRPVHEHDADSAVALDEDVRLRHVYDEFTSLTIDRPEKWILRITLTTPGKLNAVGHEAHAQLAAVWQTIDRDADTRVVLVRGADGAFSSGGDLDLVEDIAKDWETRLRVFHEARDLAYNIVNC